MAKYKLILDDFGLYPMTTDQRRDLMEIVEERLEREFSLNLLVTAPSVRYRVLRSDGDVVEVDSPARLPEPGFCM